MTWVCNKCTAPFSVGAPRCPEQSCRARDAHEEGGDPAVNVYDAVKATGIGDPGEAWSTVHEGVAAARNELHRAGKETVTQTEGVTAVLASEGQAEVAGRLGLVPGDPGAADSSTDPDPVPSSGTEVLEESGVSAGHGDMPDAGKVKGGTKAGQKDVLS